MKYFLDKVLTIRRLRAVDSNRSTYSATGTADGYPCCQQEPSANKVQMYEGQIGNIWECYVEEDCPAVEADQVVISSQTYSVQNIKVMDFGSQHFKRLVITKSGNAS